MLWQGVGALFNKEEFALHSLLKYRLGSSQDDTAFMEFAGRGHDQHWNSFSCHLMLYTLTLHDYKRSSASGAFNAAMNNDEN